MDSHMETGAPRRIRARFIIVPMMGLVLVCFAIGMPVDFADLPCQPGPKPEKNQRVVLRSPGEWENWWGSVAHPRRSLAPPVPGHVISKTMIIAVAKGSCGTTGYDTKVRGIYENPLWLNVFYDESSPGRGPKRALGPVPTVFREDSINRFLSVFSALCSRRTLR